MTTTQPPLDASAQSALRLLLQTKIWERENLPLNNSLIALELLLVVAICRAEGQPLSVGVLTGGSGFSALGAANHMRRLQREGYIALEAVSTDRRVKTIVPTPKLDQLMVAYAGVLDDCLGRHRALSQETPAPALIPTHG